MKLTRVLFAYVIMLAMAPLWAASLSSTDGAWTLLDSAGISSRSTPSARKWVDPDIFQAYSINTPVVTTQAFSAPSDLSRAPRDSSTIITVPRPDGTFERFSIVDVQTMEPALAAQFPGIRTFSGAGIDDPSASLRGDIGPQGFRASVRNDSGWYYVDPLYHGNTNLHVSYYLTDSGPQTPLECNVSEISTLTPTAAGLQAARDAFGTDFRTVRLAMAATGEYAATIDGTVAGTQAAIVSVVNRINQIYEAEVAVRMILVGNNTSIIYTNGGTDPYTDGNTVNLMAENQSNVDSVIGNGNYDVSEVLNSTGSGQAALNSVCDNSNKARGTSSIRGAGPLDNQSVYHSAHELGHQFGANHTWNGVAGNCSNANWANVSAYEPGSGTTIMGYPGTCSTDDIRIGKEAYFHRDSLNLMMSYIVGSVSCSTLNPSGNQPPTVNAGTDIVVPVNTPFKLNATGSDPNGDTIYYCWEQFDLGSAQRALGTADDGTGPLFRSRFPTVNTARYFPNNPANTSTAEVPFTVANKDRNFQVTARDFRSGGGGTNNDAMIVHTIDAPATPFRVTVGNTAGEVWTGASHLITWDVAGTDTLPYNIFNVNIMLSIDGGETYAYMLKENTPNDGSETVLLPNINSNQVRIRVEPTGSGVFDISDANIIVGGHIEFNPVVGDFGIVCPGDIIERTLEIYNTGPGDLTISSITPAGSAAFSLVRVGSAPVPTLPLTIQPGEHVNYTIHLATPLTPGPITKTWTVASTDLAQPMAQFTASATVGEPNIQTMIPNSGSFGQVCLDSLKDMPITVNNTGMCDLKISSITSNSPDFIVPGVMTYPLTVQAGTSLEIPIRFKPTSLGPKAGIITINSNDPDTPVKQVAVSGEVPGGRITVSPCPLDFGLVCPEDLQARMKTVQVCNVGTCPLNIASITLSNTEFTLADLPPLPVTLQSGSCFDFTVKFTPSTVGPKTATLTVTSDDPVNPVVMCTVSGETEPNRIGTPAKIPFQPTVISTVAHCPGDEPLAIVDTGMCQVKITTVTITGTNADSFSLVGLPTTTEPLTLAPGEQLGDGDLKVRFLPAEMLTERFHVAQVNIGFIRDPFSMEESTATVALAGEACQTGFRMIVLAGGVPVDNVVKIVGTVKGLKAGGNKSKTNLKLLNSTLRSVTAPDPFSEDLSFQYHAEFGGLTNSTQLPTGDVLLKVTYQIGKVKKTKTVRFQNLDSCTFNKDVIVNF